jgi:hypothetical protein
MCLRRLNNIFCIIGSTDSILSSIHSLVSHFYRLCLQITLGTVCTPSKKISIRSGDTTIFQAHTRLITVTIPVPTRWYKLGSLPGIPARLCSAVFAHIFLHSTTPLLPRKVVLRPPGVDRCPPPDRHTILNHFAHHPSGNELGRGGRRRRSRVFNHNRSPV